MRLILISCLTVACSPDVQESAEQALVCGPGTELVGQECIPVHEDPAWTYSVEIESLEVDADGVSRVPISVQVLPADSSAEHTVLLSLSRQTAGQIEEPELTFEGSVGETMFVACDDRAAEQCPGLAYVSLALPAAPNVPVARTEDFELVSLPVPDSVRPCEPHENALYLEGDGYVYTGQQLFSDEDASFEAVQIQGGPGIDVRVTPDDRERGIMWFGRFMPPQNETLETAVYLGASRSNFNGNPGLSVFGDGRGCNRSLGSFEVHRLTRAQGSNDPVTFLVSFEQFCEEELDNVLRGCAKYTGEDAR